MHKNRLTLPDFLNVENLILPKWQIFCPPSFFCHQVGHPRVEIFLCLLLFLYYFSFGRLLEIVFHSWHVGGAVLLKVNLHAWRKSSFLGTCQKNLSSFPLRFLNFIKSEMLGIFSVFLHKAFLLPIAIQTSVGNACRFKYLYEYQCS